MRISDWNSDVCSSDLFADDTGIFQPKDIFLQLIDNDTRPDGSDMGLVLSQLFDVLDTPEARRQKGLSGELDAFPYVNGDVFAGRLRIPQFRSEEHTSELQSLMRISSSGLCLKKQQKKHHN